MDKNDDISLIEPSEKSIEYLKENFPNTSKEQWNDWRWQIKNSITNIKQLNDFFNLNDNEKSINDNNKDSLPIRITPYYSSLIDKNNSLQSLRKSVIPIVNEYYINEGELSDPLNENEDNPVPNIIHRYPDRVLFLATDFCATYCRYCTRSHIVAKEKNLNNWESAFNYLREHTEIRDVIISGGDPLTLPDSQLDYLLSTIRNIKHIEIIRIGTKVPVILPQRINKKLINILQKYHPLFMSIHFTHPDEITPEVKQACNLLANAGIPLGSQTVLLKGINDDSLILKKLFHELLKVRVRPYYLYQCDPILGSEHFRTSIEKGIEIMFNLRGNTSGYAIPTFVIDAPGGGGKIPILPEYYQGKDENGNLILKNYQNKLFNYPNIE